MGEDTVPRDDNPADLRIRHKRCQAKGREQKRLRRWQEKHELKIKLSRIAPAVHFPSACPLSPSHGSKQKIQPPSG